MPVILADRPQHHYFQQMPKGSRCFNLCRGVCQVLIEFIILRRALGELFVKLPHGRVIFICFKQIIHIIPPLVHFCEPA